MKTASKSVNGNTGYKDREKKYFAGQARIFHQYLYRRIATCSMAADATGIKQKCLTRYKRKLEKQGLLWEVRKGICRKTGQRAAYLTTNPRYAGVSTSTYSTHGNGK